MKIRNVSPLHFQAESSPVTIKSEDQKIKKGWSDILQSVSSHHFFPPCTSWLCKLWLSLTKDNSAAIGKSSPQGPCITPNLRTQLKCALKLFNYTNRLPHSAVSSAHLCQIVGHHITYSWVEVTKVESEAESESRVPAIFFRYLCFCISQRESSIKTEMSPI